MDLHALTDFHLVVTHGGIGRASRASGRPKATLSRRVMELERSLGVRLLDRGSRSLRLTEEGTTLHARTKGLLSEIVEVGVAIGEGTDRPRGRLRIGSPVLFAHNSLVPIAAAFLRAHPEVRIEVVAEDRVIDPVEEGFDLVIRINPPPDERLVGRRILRDGMLIVAPSAMARPAPDAIATVPAVVLTNPADPGIWHAVEGGREWHLRPDPLLRVSSKLILRDAVRAGVGAALMPRTLISDDLASGHLSCWGEASGRAAELWAMHTPGRLVSSKVTAFVEFLCDAFEDHAS